MLLPGCGSVERFYDTRLPFDTPIDWWHQLQGGALADERPPPPGVADPYPSLSQVPARPAPSDPAARRALSARLTSQRDRTERLAAQDPIEQAGPPAIPAPLPGGTLARPGASATPPPAGTAPPPASEPPMARLDAAEAKPDAAPAPARSAATAAGSPAAPSSRMRTPAATPEASDGDGAPPPLPTGAPSIPMLPGLPASTFEPATPKPSPQVDADFVASSAVLRPNSADALRELAARRGGGNVAILGGGEARSAQPDAQAAALPLAWRRARAIEDVLLASGVPTSAMRVDAAALARGGIARLVD
jgi:outer membrane protein OmpA-like peptidoglycan-associated protein